MHNTIKAIFYTFLCIALWALIPVFSKLGQTELNNHQFLFWSSVISFLAFLISTAAIGQIRSLFTYRLRDLFSAVFLGFLGAYLYYILLYFGYANAKGLEVLVLQYSWPFFIVLLSAVLLKETLTLKRIVSVLCGFAGVVLVLTQGDFTAVHLENLRVDALVLIAAFSFALFSVLSKNVKLAPYPLITIFYLTATVCSFLSMLLLSGFAWPTTGSLIPILINGLFLNGFSYIFWIKALSLAEASYIAPLMFFTPVLAAIYLVIFFHEPFLPVYGLGLFAVLIGGLLNREKDDHSPKRQKRTRQVREA